MRNRFLIFAILKTDYALRFFSLILDFFQIIINTLKIKTQDKDSFIFK